MKYIFKFSHNFVDKQSMAKLRGFSFLELLVAVAIILILCAIAATRLQRARLAANRVSAVASLHVIDTAQAVYESTYPAAGYSPSLVQLGSNGSDCQNTTKTNACLLDSGLAGGIRNGYIFEITGDGKVPSLAYSVTATPQAPGLSGDCAYASDQSTHIHPIIPTTDARTAGGGGAFAGCSSP
ncbi:MAG TPA: type II secretion system protein [Candidatus Angelobacter sp.]|nr:type II secretion system protein [Candidatus Angelobacter sp.]